jgi:aspartate aminotransferase-like enzyme
VYPANGDPAFNLTSGPAGATAATLAALGRPILHHLDPAFGALYQRTVELLRQAFGTRESPVILQGEAVVGLEAAAASLMGPGDVVLNLVSGMFGRGYGEWARRYAREVIEIEVPYDSSVPVASVAEACPCCMSARPPGRGWRRIRPHQAAARAARAGAEALGLTLWARDPLVRSDTVTAVRMPDEIDEQDVRALARADSGVMLSGGQGDLARIVLQIGHMGTGAFPLGPVIAVTALGRALRSLGARADIGAAVEAAVSALDA